MTKQYSTAAEATAANSMGAVTLLCTLAEAAKLAGQQTRDAEGRAAWFTSPMAYAPGQPRDAAAVWHVGVSVSKVANDASVAAFRAAQAAWL